MAEHNDQGDWGEDLAVEYLLQKGYVMVNRDWVFGRSKRDVDIICLTPDLQTMVFVEVKCREHEEVTEPGDAVDASKIRRIGRAVNEYVKTNDVVQDLRFDIVTIIGRKNSKNKKINQIEDAFNPLLV